ncbi:MAG: nuclear transport factor 2 family protein [Sandaracinus sp.]
MPSPTTLERFIARVEENAHAEAIAEFYAEDGSIQENVSPPRVGRDALVARERGVMARADRITSTCVRPVLVSGDHAVIRWRFRFDWKDGTVTEMEELAYQTWRGEQLVLEQFFYDPAQRAPKKP